MEEAADRISTSTKNQQFATEPPKNKKYKTYNLKNGHKGSGCSFRPAPARDGSCGKRQTWAEV
jgi:hypothetical protein